MNLTHPTHKRLGDLLLEMGLITRIQLEEALREQSESRKRLGETLVAMKLLSEADMALAIAIQLGIPFLDLPKTNFDPQAISKVPEQFARRGLYIPVRFEGRYLLVAMVDPLNLKDIEDVTFSSGCEVTPAVATRSEVIEALKKHYRESDDTIDHAAQDIMEEVSSLEILPDDRGEEEAGNPDQNSPFVRMVDLIIAEAIKNRTSDIHIEPETTLVRVRNRIDGVLKNALTLPRWMHPVLVSRIKILGNMDITERRLPQDGRVRVKNRGEEVDLRISTLPTQHGEKAVIRIFTKGKKTETLEDLGFAASQAKLIQSFVSTPEGLMLVTGPTGSGKSSTLYTCLQTIRSESINIITVEDPVEYQIEGINQIQVNEHTGLTFPYVLRAILRQDPDVVMVGEIRDEETSQIAVQGALTGHLVLSTLHTNDAPATITRLLNIGIPPYLVASSLVGIVAQRLVRRICPHCREPYTPSEAALLSFNMDPENLPFEFFHGAGCRTCGESGYMGRIVISEVMPMTARLREMILSGASEDALRDTAIASGMITLGEDGLEKVKTGVTTIEEILGAVRHREELATACPHCDKTVNLEFTHCPFCKKSLLLSCLNCGRGLQRDWVVCPYCRHETTEQADSGAPLVPESKSA